MTNFILEKQIIMSNQNPHPHVGNLLRSYLSKNRISKAEAGRKLGVTTTEVVKSICIDHLCSFMCYGIFASRFNTISWRIYNRNFRRISRELKIPKLQNFKKRSRFSNASFESKFENL